MPPSTKKCAYKGCTETQSSSNLGLSFHHFPKHKQRSREWARRCGCDCLGNEGIWLQKNSKICSKHFSENDYVGDSKKNRRLKDYAIPRDCNEMADTDSMQIPDLEDSPSPASSIIRAKSIKPIISPPDGDRTPKRTFRENNEMKEFKRRKLEQSDSTLNPMSGSDFGTQSPWEWRSITRENSSLQARLSHQEAAVQELDKIRQEMEEVFMKEKNMLENQAELDKETIEQLESRLKTSMKSTREAREALSSAKNEVYQTKLKSEQKTMALMAENSEAQLKLEAAEDLIAELKEKLDEQESFEVKFELQNAELRNAKLEIEKLESERAFCNDEEVLSAQTARAKKLEEELSQANEMISVMKKSEKDKRLLEEQILNLEHIIERMERIEQPTAFMKVEARELVTEVAETETIGIENISHAFNPEADPLQQDEAISNINSLTEEHEILQTKYDEVKKLTIELTSSNGMLEEQIGRLQRRINLVVRERDSYRQQLDLYEKEISGNESNTAITERIPALEKLLEDYRQLVNKLETDLSYTSNSEATELKEECKMLKEEVNRLKSELKHGDFPGKSNNLAGIPHYKVKPTEIVGRQAEDEQKELSSEKLKAQLKNTETHIEEPSPQAEVITDLEKTGENRRTKLKEAFKVSVDLLETAFSATLEQLSEHHP